MSKGKYNSASELELADLLNDIKSADNSTNIEQSDERQVSSDGNDELIKEQQDIPAADMDMSTAEVVVTEKATSEEHQETDFSTNEIIHSEHSETVIKLTDKTDTETFGETVSASQATEGSLDGNEKDSKITYQFIKVNSKKDENDSDNKAVVDLLIKCKSKYFHNKLSEKDLISIIELTQEFLYTENKEKRKYKSDTFKFSINLKVHNGTCDVCNKKKSTFVVFGINNKNAVWFCEDCAKKFVYRTVKFVSRNLGKKALIPIKQYFDLNNIQYVNLEAYLQKIPTADASKKQKKPSQEPTILKSKAASISRDKETEYKNKIMNLEWQLGCVNSELLVYKRENEILREKLQEQEGVLFKIKQTLDIGKSKTKYIMSFLKDILTLLK